MDEKKRAFQFALLIVLGLRLITGVILAASAGGSGGVDCPDYYPCSQPVLDDLKSTAMGRVVLAPWYRWDAVHYLDKADNRYQLLGAESTVWPPLYPFLIRVFSFVMPGMTAALLISTLASLAAFYLLYREVCARWDESAARWAVVLTAVFPSGFFWMGAYSEALFLALSLGVFAGIRRQRWWMAGICGALAVLTRLQGIFLLLPLAWEGYAALRKQLAGANQRVIITAVLREKSFLPILGGTLLIPLTMTAYFAFIHFGQGAPWPWQSLSSGWGRGIGWPWQGVVNNIAFMLKNPFHQVMVSMFMDVFALMVFLGVLTARVKQMPVSYLSYGSVMLIFPALFLSGNWATLTSISRYILSAFPAFIALALILCRHRYARMLWIAFSMAGQIILLYLFTSWVWVA